MTWKYFLYYLPFVRGIHRSPQQWIPPQRASNVELWSFLCYCRTSFITHWHSLQQSLNRHDLVMVLFYTILPAYFSIGSNFNWCNLMFSVFIVLLFSTSLWPYRHEIFVVISQQSLIQWCFFHVLFCNCHMINDNFQQKTVYKNNALQMTHMRQYKLFSYVWLLAMGVNAINLITFNYLIWRSSLSQYWKMLYSRHQGFTWWGDHLVSRSVSWW